MNSQDIEALKARVDSIRGILATEHGVNERLIEAEFDAAYPLLIELIGTVEELSGAKEYAEALDEKWDWCVEAVRGMARQLELPEATLPITAGEVVSYLDKIADGIEEVKPSAATGQ